MLQLLVVMHAPNLMDANRKPAFINIPILVPLYIKGKIHFQGSLIAREI